ncbi:pre-mRNA splicing factor [Artemisia annua]|uniref:Pre-mRNA splicing factor n=1 Tax=Artemisia annua TaxID=35608 RepID=A0A2U1MJJ4_ARTAN|nr:pre-mRNA splicing factor [Artemisia annua]
MGCLGLFINAADRDCLGIEAAYQGTKPPNKSRATLPPTFVLSTLLLIPNGRKVQFPYGKTIQWSKAYYWDLYPKITKQFVDSKRKLVTLYDADWEGIPEIRDYLLRNKKRFESYGPSRMQDVTAVGEGRGTVLGFKLDRISDSVSGLTVVDPKGHLIDLQSMKMQAASLEHGDVIKSKVLRKGLEHILDSLRLWKAVVELANEEDAKLLLQRAVECCPLHVEFWLALAWGVRALQREGVEIDREVWTKEAKAAEWVGSVAICYAIIGNIIGIGDEKEDRMMTWFADANECEKRGSIESAGAIYGCAIDEFKSTADVWLNATRFEKEFGTRKLRRCGYWVLKKSVWLVMCLPQGKSFPQLILLFLIPKRYSLLCLSLNLKTTSLKGRGCFLLKVVNGEEKEWMKSAIVERELSNSEEERRLLDEGLRLFHSLFKLWLEERQGRLPKVKRDVGYFWSILYKFELQFGTEHQQNEVLLKCAAAEPKYGEKWQPIPKAIPVSIADLGGTNVDQRFSNVSESLISVVVTHVLRFVDYLEDDTKIEKWASRNGHQRIQAKSNRTKSRRSRGRYQDRKNGPPEKVINAFRPEVIGLKVEGGNDNKMQRKILRRCLHRRQYDTYSYSEQNGICQSILQFNLIFNSGLLDHLLYVFLRWKNTMANMNDQVSI